MIILLLPRWRLFVDCAQYLRLSCLMMVDEALSFSWDEDVCRNHSLLLSLWKFSFCSDQPAKPDWADMCGGGLEVHRRLECFSFPLLIDSSNPNSYLAVWWDLFAIDWFDGRKKSLGHSKQRRKSCDSLKWSEWVDDTQTFTAYFMGCSLTETP